MYIGDGTPSHTRWYYLGGVLNFGIIGNCRPIATQADHNGQQESVFLRVQEGDEEARDCGNNAAHQECPTSHALAADNILKQQNRAASWQIVDRREREELKGRCPETLHITVYHIIRQSNNDAVGIDKIRQEPKADNRQKLTI